jgi:hypothetical protein
MLSAIVEALRSASATEEIIAAAVNAPTETQGAARASKDRAYRERKKARDETRDEIGRADCRAGRLGDETRDETPAIQVPRDETREAVNAAGAFENAPKRQRGRRRQQGRLRQGGFCDDGPTSEDATSNGGRRPKASKEGNRGEGTSERPQALQGSDRSV